MVQNVFLQQQGCPHAGLSGLSAPQGSLPTSDILAITRIIEQHTQPRVRHGSLIFIGTAVTGNTTMHPRKQADVLVFPQYQLPSRFGEDLTTNPG